MVAYPGWEKDHNNRWKEPDNDPAPVNNSPEPYLNYLIRDLEILAHDILEQVQQGVVNHIILSAVTTTYFSTPIKFAQASYSVQLINDGPEILDYRIPFDNLNTGQLNAGEEVSFSFRKPVLLQIGVQARTATTGIRVVYSY